MKRKTSFIILFLMLCPLILSGCKGISESLTDTTSQSVENNTSSQDGLPPLEDNYKELYQGAEALYTKIVFGNFHCDVTKELTKNNYTYYRVDEPEFDSYDAFTTYLSKYFTENFISQNILTPDSIRFLKGEDGALYLLDAGRGSNIFYAGHVFHSVQRTENKITFTATVYYATGQEGYEGDPIFTEPENISDFSTQNFTFSLVKEGDNWKFDQFVCFF